MKINFKNLLTLKFFLKSSYLLSIGFFLLDLIKYYGFVKNHLFLSPIEISLIILIVHIVLILLKKDKLGDKFAEINLLYLAPISVILWMVIFYFEEFGPLFPNYFFNNFKFHYYILPFMAIPGLTFGFLHSSRSFLEYSWKKIFFISMILLAAGAEIYFLLDDHLHYLKFVSEDGVVENLTALFFFISGIFAFLLRKRAVYFKQEIIRKIFFWACIVISLALFLVAFEEISWGQRIFNFKTPEFLRANNRQGEINLHNSEAFWPFVYTAYGLIASYGLGAWIANWLSKDILFLKKEDEIWQRILVPGAHLFFNFAAIGLYVWLRDQHGPWKYQPWEEITELFLVIGITIHLAELFLSQKIWQKNK